MRTFSFIILLCFFSLTSLHAQYGIVKTYLFTQTNFAGNIAVDEYGKQLTPGVTTAVFIYIKSKKIPLFKTATINGKTYSVEIIKLKDKVILVGENETNQEPIQINVEESFSIYQLILTPNIVPALENNKTLLKIKLKGSWEKQKVSYVINQKPIGLYSLPRP
jgi:hypothetical protein